MARIICVSNRVSLPDPETGKIKAGGLAVGVRAALESQGGGIWFGWDGHVVPTAAERGQYPVKRQENGAITFLTMPLTQREYGVYYKRMANEGLWPFMHELASHVTEDGSAFSGYAEVNGLFARMLQPFLEPDDVIWVHDYHLIPLGEALRNLGVRNKILYFHHIPIPSREFIMSTKAPAQLRTAYDMLMHTLFAYDQVGFQSQRDLRNFMAYMSAEIVTPPRYTAIPVSDGEKVAQFGVFPISVETSILEETAKSQPKAPREHDCIVLGAERLDYTKGLKTRVEAVGALLRRYPQYLGKVQYVQITPLSRDDITQYKQTIDETRDAVQSLKAEFDRAGWSPVRYSEENISRDELMGLFRTARVGLVTPFMDGQNLVAKEFIASQDAEDPGVLVLSRRAGCAEELSSLGALTVNPFDPTDIADKLHLALEMPHDDRVRNHAAMLQHLRTYNIDHWARSFLEQAADGGGMLTDNQHSPETREDGYARQY